MLEPRRLAARAAASRIAEEQGWKLGGKVGYQVRFDNHTSRETELCVMTEGLLNRRLARDPQLKGVGLVILDEFHERSWYSDLALGLLRELQLLGRPDLKILVMSATLQAEQVADFLGNAPVFDVPAPRFALDIHHDREPQLLTSGKDLVHRVGSTVTDVLDRRRAGQGDILVFLPGVREINAVANFLSNDARRMDGEIHLLHGSLSLDQQDRAIQRSQKRKIVLATNIAETSITIDGVATVIDAGLARVMRQDAAGFPRLELSRISRFSAIQRSGRAARQQPGVCHRLWNKMDEASLAEAETPEILRTDLAEAILLLASFGVTDFSAFSWFETPTSNSLERARALLAKLGALQSKAGKPSSRPPTINRESTSNLVELTDLGRRLLEWPLHPRLARMMEEVLSRPGTSEKDLKLAAHLAAIVGERDFVSEPETIRFSTNVESDTLLRLEIFNERRSPQSVDPSLIQMVRRVAEQIEHIAQSKLSRVASTSRSHATNLSAAAEDAQTEKTALQLLLLAFPDRVARRRRSEEPEARMVGGRGVRLSKASCVTKSELFVAVDVVSLDRNPGDFARSSSPAADATVTQASRIETSWLKQYFPDDVSEQRSVAIEEKSGKIMRRIVTVFDDLPLEEPRWTQASADEMALYFPQLVASEWKQILEKNKSATIWLARLNFLKATLPEQAWPEFDVLNVSDLQTKNLINSISFDEASLETIFAKDLTWHFENAFGAEISGLVRHEAPETLLVPTGNHMRIHYPDGRPPYVEVRLQEMFGVRESPTIAKGRQRLTFQLLGPNFRPVQVTSDLASFWANGYADVRKEMRARYPKHSWPDDPLTAAPVAKGRGRPR